MTLMTPYQPDPIYQMRARPQQTLRIPEIAMTGFAYWRRSVR